MLEISILIKISNRMIFLMVIDDMDLNFKILHSFYSVQFPTPVFIYYIIQTFKQTIKINKHICLSIYYCYYVN